MTDRSEDADHAARAMREDVIRVSRGRPCHWVTVHEVAQRFVADGEPPHSVRLSVVAIQPG
jgi:hypothetical protein